MGPASADTIPYHINYQGRLLDGTNLFNGQALIEFVLFNGKSSSFIHSMDTQRVQVVDGLYSAIIGDTLTPSSKPLKEVFEFFHTNLYLEVRVNSVALTPREVFKAAAFALRSGIPGEGNVADGILSSMGGGLSNVVSSAQSGIGGGKENIISAQSDFAVIGGGRENSVSGFENHGAVIAGGQFNEVWGGVDEGVVSGGRSNEVSGNFAMVPGGLGNTASGQGSLAAGTRASAVHQGSFVWGDSASTEVFSDRSNQFKVRASGGMVLETESSGLNPAGLKVTSSTDDGVAIFATQDSSDTTMVVVNKGIGNVFKAYAGPTGGDLVFLVTTNKVGVGREPTVNALEVEGTASKTTSGSWLANSDARIKTEVAPLTGALDVISRLVPVQFRYTEAYRAQHPSIEDITYFNYVAQEYRAVFPDYVKDSGEDGILQIDTHPAVVYAVAAIQELLARSEAKDKMIGELESRVAALEKELAGAR